MVNTAVKSKRTSQKNCNLGRQQNGEQEVHGTAMGGESGLYDEGCLTLNIVRGIIYVKRCIYVYEL